jgi:hypothetical protein
MEQYFQQKVKLLNDEARSMHKNISDHNLFVKIYETGSEQDEDEGESNPEEGSGSDNNSENEDNSEDMDPQLHEDMAGKRKKVPNIDISDEEQIIVKEEEYHSQ